MYFLHKRDIPQDIFKDVTCVKFICNVFPKKLEPNRTILTVGGDIINYPGGFDTPSSDMLLMKMLVNSVISKTGAKYMIVYINIFYFNTTLKRYRYVRLQL